MEEENKPEKELKVKSEIDKIKVSIVENTIDLQKTVYSRGMTRYKKLQELSRAKHTKISQGSFVKHITEPPKVNMFGLEFKIVGGIGYINYGLYKTDPKTGNRLNDETLKEPIQDCMVEEIIENRKPIKQNVLNL